MTTRDGGERLDGRNSSGGTGTDPDPTFCDADHTALPYAPGIILLSMSRSSRDYGKRTSDSPSSLRVHGHFSLPVSTTHDGPRTAHCHSENASSAQKR